MVTTALAFGLVLGALVYAIGPISGCHVNPAVTLGFIASGRMKLAEGVGLPGGPVRRGHRRRLPPVLDVHHLAAVLKVGPGPGHRRLRRQSHLLVSQGGAFLIEVVLTAIFVLVVLFATHKAAIQGAAGWPSASPW